MAKKVFWVLITSVSLCAGYWLLHCHITFHIEVGMGLVFKVGQQSMFPPVPDNFPRCGSWLPPRTESLRSSIDRWQNSLESSNQPPSIHLIPSENGTNSQMGPPYYQSSIDVANDAHSNIALWVPTIVLLLTCFVMWKWHDMLSVSVMICFSCSQHIRITWLPSNFYIVNCIAIQNMALFK